MTPQTTQQKMDALEATVNGKMDSTEADKAWTMLNQGWTVSVIAALINAGTFVETPSAFIPQCLV